MQITVETWRRSMEMVKLTQQAQICIIEPSNAKETQHVSFGVLFQTLLHKFISFFSFKSLMQSLAECLSQFLNTNASFTCMFSAHYKEAVIKEKSCLACCMYVGTLPQFRRKLRTYLWG